MEKGWNKDYLNEMINKYQTLTETCQDPNLKEEYKMQEMTYTFISFLLLFQDGEIYNSPLTTKKFLKEINNEEYCYTYDSNTSRILANFAKEFISMKRTPEYSYKDKISQKESYEIVETFIRENFDKDNLDKFIKFFYFHKDYILYDKLNGSPSTNFPKNDLPFVVLPSSEDIYFTSSLAHEAGHVYSLDVNKTLIKDSPLSEFESFSYEIRLLDWMVKNNIYSKDAIKHLLNIMRLMENIFITRYYNNIFKLHKIKDASHFDKRVNELELKHKLRIQNKTELFQLIFNCLDNNYVPYLYSYLLVLSNLDDPEYLEKYRYVINNILTEDLDVLKEHITAKDITDLTKYKEYKKSLIKKL